MKGIKIVNKAAGSAEILIYEDIGEGFFTEGVTAAGFLRELRALGDVRALDVRINSNGGSVFDGIAIYNALRQHPARKTVHVDGIAASIASVIAMAGDEIRMGEGAWMMIHDPSGLAMGTAENMRATADLLDQVKQQLIAIYALRTRQDEEAIAAMMAAETWLDAAAALDHRFADTLAEPIRLVAHVERERFRNIPGAVLAGDLTDRLKKKIEAQAEPPPPGPTEQQDPGAASAALSVSTPRKEITMNVMEKLQARASEHQSAAAAIRTKATAEGRELTDAERSVLNSHLAEFDTARADIEIQAKLENAENWLAQPAGRKLAPDGLQNTVLPTTRERNSWGFKSMGDFAASVRNAVLTPSQMDPRLISNATLSTYGTEGTNSEGGFAVPPEWSSQIMKLVSAEESLLSMTDQQTTSGNMITFPTDETTAWQTTGGILSYWTGEAGAMTQSRPALKSVTLRLDKLTVLVPVTDELLEDSASMGNYVSGKAGEKIAYKINTAIVNGTGAGQPYGILNAACTVSVAKETSQAAATVLAANVLKMWARMPAMNRRRAVWLVNPDVESQLMQMNIETKNVAGSENVSGMPAFLPPGGLSGSPYATLMGRPIIPTDACATLGTVGDIILADLGSYLTVTKSGGLRSDASIHLWFDQNTTAFRFVMRLAGQPWLSTYITPASGTNYRSHFVTLATR